MQVFETKTGAWAKLTAHYIQEGKEQRRKKSCFKPRKQVQENRNFLKARATFT